MMLLLLALAAIQPALAAVNDLRITQVSGDTGIVDISHAGDGSQRLFLVEQSGRVLVHRDGTTLATPFLDISSRVATAGNEQGLLSIAFAPDYAVSGVFYTWYTESSGDTVLERFSVSENSDEANAASGNVLLEVPQPFSNHNGGRIRFGPDGMLYLGLGDGGGSFDPNNAGQTATTLLGKLIRIDVNPVHGSYAIPADNPYADTDFFLDEIWASGLRNPWRISFDSLTGDLFVADVGQNQLEEVNFQLANSSGGENYGWVIMEGSQCVQGGCDTTGLTLPVAEYGHGPHCSISGGEVYRGSAYPGMHGTYLYGDFCSGQIWGLENNGGQWQSTALQQSGLNITTFGQGEDGSVYVSGRNSGVFLLSDGPVRAEQVFELSGWLNDSWYNPDTAGQGFFVTVFEDSGQVFLAWFTYDTERPPASVQAILGEPGHRWLTAFGPYEGNRATLEIELTEGGVFNAPQPVPQQTLDGTIYLEFDGCNRGRVIFDVASPGLQGAIPIERISAENLAACEDAQP